MAEKKVRVNHETWPPVRNRLGSPRTTSVRLSPDVLEVLEELARRTGVSSVSELLRFSVMEVKQVMGGGTTLVPNAPPRLRRALVPEDRGARKQKAQGS